MWIASALGYFSIVKKKNTYYVRARNENDLRLLMDATGVSREILQYAGTDYVARILVNQSELDLIMRTLFSTIQYDNFKNSIIANSTQRDKCKYYSEVWGVMWDYQRDREEAQYQAIANKVNKKGKKKLTATKK